MGLESFIYELSVFRKEKEISGESRQMKYRLIFIGSSTPSEKLLQSFNLVHSHKLAS